MKMMSMKRELSKSQQIQSVLSNSWIEGSDQRLVGKEATGRLTIKQLSFSLKLVLTSDIEYLALDLRKS